MRMLSMRLKDHYHELKVQKATPLTKRIDLNLSN